MSQIQLRMDVWDAPAVSLNPKICEGHRSSKSPACGSIPAPRLLLWSPWKWPCHLPPGAPGSSDGMVHKPLPTGWLPRAQGPVGLAPRGEKNLSLLPCSRATPEGCLASYGFTVFYKLKQPSWHLPSQRRKEARWLLPSRRRKVACWLFSPRPQAVLFHATA